MPLPILEVFADLPDPRRETENKLHRLTDILTLAVCAVIAGAETWDAIAEYGVAIADLATGVRRNVIASVERMTGLQVTEVNISVADVHLPSDDTDEDADADAAPRVR